jgi:hypothetical protein
MIQSGQNDCVMDKLRKHVFFYMVNRIALTNPSPVIPSEARNLGFSLRAKNSDPSLRSA